MPLEEAILTGAHSHMLLQEVEEHCVGERNQGSFKHNGIQTMYIQIYNCMYIYPRIYISYYIFYIHIKICI